MTKLEKPATSRSWCRVVAKDDRVYGGWADGTPVALKVLAQERPSADKRRRFKNDISFLVGNKHRNGVTVIDHGVARAGAIDGPCYVMRRHQELM